MAPGDRFAIEDLFAVYHWALDTADVEGFADTLTEDGFVELETTQRMLRFDGRSGMIHLAEGLRAWDAFPGCQHYAGQLRIEALDADCCRVRSFGFVAECRGEAPYALRYTGRSDDVVVRHGARWLFAERRVQFWRGDAIHNDFLASPQSSRAQATRRPR